MIKRDIKFINSLREQKSNEVDLIKIKSPRVIKGEGGKKI